MIHVRVEIYPDMSNNVLPQLPWQQAKCLRALFQPAQLVRSETWRRRALHGTKIDPSSAVVHCFTRLRRY